MLPGEALWGQSGGYAGSVRVVVCVIVVLAAVIAASLLRESGGGGAGMVVFAILTVVALSVLPVVFGRAASRGDGPGREEVSQEVACFDPEDSADASGSRGGEPAGARGYPPLKPPPPGNHHADHDQPRDK